MELNLGDLDRFLAEYDQDENVWWTLSGFKMQEYFDALLARYQELSIKIERLEDELAELKPMAEYGENLAQEFP